jgi:hypothetical protein
VGIDLGLLGNRLGIPWMDWLDGFNGFIDKARQVGYDAQNREEAWLKTLTQ